MQTALRELPVPRSPNNLNSPGRSWTWLISTGVTQGTRHQNTAWTQAVLCCKQGKPLKSSTWEQVVLQPPGRCLQSWIRAGRGLGGPGTDGVEETPGAGGSVQQAHSPTASPQPWALPDVAGHTMGLWSRRVGGCMEGSDPHPTPQLTAR